ncbi:hypothetical protein GCM10027519_28590 [Kineococcus endophyticus]
MLLLGRLLLALDLDRQPAGGIRLRVEGLEEDGLADPAQAVEDRRCRGTTLRRSVDDRTACGELGLAADQSRWGLACSRGVRVAGLVRAATFLRLYNRSCYTG